MIAFCAFLSQLRNRKPKRKQSTIGPQEPAEHPGEFPPNQENASLATKYLRPINLPSLSIFNLHGSPFWLSHSVLQWAFWQRKGCFCLKGARPFLLPSSTIRTQKVFVTWCTRLETEMAQELGFTVNRRIRWDWSLYFKAVSTWVPGRVAMHQDALQLSLPDTFPCWLRSVTHHHQSTGHTEEPGPQQNSRERMDRGEQQRPPHNQGISFQQRNSRNKTSKELSFQSHRLFQR